MMPMQSQTISKYWTVFKMIIFIEFILINIFVITNASYRDLVKEQLYYYDDNHLSQQGLTFVIKDIIDTIKMIKKIDKKGRSVTRCPRPCFYN